MCFENKIFLTNLETYKMSKKPYIEISVDNVPFDSVKEAADLCDISKGALYNALNKNLSYVKGYVVQKLGKHSYNLYKSETKPVQKAIGGPKAAVQVKCLETGKIYPSIGAIAKELGINMWTMSVKMEETGKFIDKQGKSYIRLSPMVKKVDHTYGFKTSSITRNINRTKPVETKTVTLNTVKTNTVSQKDAIIQSLVKSANLLTDNKNYSQAAQVLTILSEFDK